MRRTLLPALALLLVLAAGTGPALAGRAMQPMSRAQFDGLVHKRGQGRLLFIMAAWCGPCRTELPALERLWRAYGGKGLEMAGISLDLEMGAMQGVLDKAGVTFPVYWVGENPIKDYDFLEIPLMLVIRDGRVVERVSGALSDEALEARARLVLGLPAP